MSAKDDYEVEIKRRNYTRAAMIAEEEGLGEEALSKARRAAFKQAVGEWFNFRGAAALAHEWGFSAKLVSELCEELVEEFKERQAREGRELQVFDVGRMDHTPVITLVTRFRDGFR